MSNCGCKEGNTYNIGMGCCVPSIMPADNFYTKPEIDEMLEDIVESGCCITEEEVDDKIEEAVSGYATEQWVLDKHYISGVDLSDYATHQWVEDKHYLTEHQPLKTINNQVISGTGNIEISSTTITVDEELDSGSTNPVANSAITNAFDDKLDASAYTPTDLSNYYNKTDINTLIADMATKTWVLQQNFATYTTLMQHITYLQDQIDDLQARIEECCQQTGETITRWVTLTGASDYCCSGTTKMSKEIEEESTDGGETWTPTGNYRTGSTVLETDSMDCGYVPPSGNVKFYGEYAGGDTFLIQCDGNPQVTIFDVQTDAPSIGGMTAATFGSCAKYLSNDVLGAASNLRTVVMEEGVQSIGHAAFSRDFRLVEATIPDSVTDIGSEAFLECSALTTVHLGSGVTYVGDSAFSACSSLSGSVELPSVTKISQDAFLNCRKITSVRIGSGCTRIDYRAFKGCTGLTSVTVESTDCYCAPMAFDGSTCPIYVPASMVETYKTTYAWRTYADRIFPITP